MNLEPDDHSSDGYGPSSGSSGPYEPSIHSSAPSSQASVFSDTLSVQSSIASSISDDFRNTQEDARERDRACAQAQLQFQARNQHLEEDQSALGKLLKANAPCPSYADVTSVPAPQRQHPRRCSLSRNQKPPPLVRQRDRKINFVDNLVDSATQMVEVIWPLSVVPCRSEGNGRGVLPLRTYIEETLRRSRTSYSTLQVALYYLILIRPHVPKTDFTMEQTVDCPADRALMCGRRMFLAALILASKYLQDRNYSAKAWSKMSGLKVCEINMNERTFLSKINWRLHIAKEKFEKWQEVVLRYSPNMPPSPSIGNTTSTWKKMVPILSPDLDNVYLGESPSKTTPQASESYGFSSPTTPTPLSCMLRPVQLDSTSQEGTPTPMTVLPRFLEPKPDIQPPTPALARMGPLPTPTLTPSSVASNTPAVSACGSRRPSISSAMAMAQHNSLSKCMLDVRYPLEGRPQVTRRPSMMSVSSGSSPESMMSDNSRSSRASSISSISTVSTNSSVAPPRACLARQATCRSGRNAGLPPLKLVKEEREGSAMKPIIIDDDVDMTSSPVMADFSVSEKALHAPHRHSRGSKHATQAASSNTSAAKGKKRGRSNGNRRSELQEEVRYLLGETYDEKENEMDLDDDYDVASPSEAAEYASRMLARDSSMTYEKPQLLATRSHNDWNRGPAQKYDGRKRTCVSNVGAMSVSPVPLYGEVQ